jgi:hypothetical protein
VARCETVARLDIPTRDLERSDAITSPLNAEITPITDKQ